MKLDFHPSVPRVQPFGRATWRQWLEPAVPISTWPTHHHYSLDYLRAAGELIMWISLFCLLGNHLPKLARCLFTKAYWLLIASNRPTPKPSKPQGARSWIHALCQICHCHCWLHLGDHHPPGCSARRNSIHSCGPPDQIRYLCKRILRPATELVKQACTVAKQDAAGIQRNKCQNCTQASKNAPPLPASPQIPATRISLNIIHVFIYIYK